MVPAQNWMFLKERTSEERKMATLKNTSHLNLKIYSNNMIAALFDAKKQKDNKANNYNKETQL